MGLKAVLYRLLIELTNGPVTSAAIRKFTNSRISRLLIKSYAAYYRIDQDEMLDDIHEYRDLHSFFTRRLKDNARMVDNSPDTVVSPVDGIIEDIGFISSRKEIIAKGKSYSIAEMLGSESAAVKYEEGMYIIIYLSPSHYHRIHSPVNGKVVHCYSLGKKSFPVNRIGLRFGRSVLAKNHRVVTEISSRTTTIGLVKIGAMFINSVIVTNKRQNWRKGEEAAYFSFGSTVVLLFQQGAFIPDDGLKSGRQIQMGKPLGQLTGEDKK